MAARPTVAIIGGGIAGLTAASLLARAGVPVTLLEARARVGGRIDTDYAFAPTPIERGAEFVHGRHPELLARIEEAGLHLQTRRFDPLVLESGRDVTSERTWDAVFEELANPAAGDVPVARRAAELVASGAWTERTARTMRRYVEGYMAADFERVSARALSIEERAAESIGGEANYSLGEGYAALVAHLVQTLDGSGARVRLDTAVRAIGWSRGHAALEARSHDGATMTITADRVLVTVPLGVLQLREGEDGAIAFDPPLPDKRRAACALAMGDVVKLFLRFRGPLEVIPNLEAHIAARLKGATFLQTPSGAVPTWWKIGEPSAPILVGWTGGPAATRLSGRSNEDIAAAGIAALAAGMGIADDVLAARIDAVAVADWGIDPWSRGAYSWVPAGSLDQSAVLARPVEDTLFFAGEATDLAGYRGTVHGAVESARRAAAEILDSMRGG